MEIKRLGTHDGVLHADEVMGTAIMLMAYPEAEVIRSRDLEVLKRKGTIVYDIGGGRYDHHSNYKKYRSNGIPYASAGLLWRDYADFILSKNYGLMENEDILIVRNKVDEELLEVIDASDNGVKTYSSDLRIMTLSGIISSYNPLWDCEEYDSDMAFKGAVEFSTRILDRTIREAISLLKVPKLLQLDLDKRDIPEVVVINDRYPWKRELLQNLDGADVLFVVFNDRSSNTYRLQTVPISTTCTRNRKDLPLEWAGKEGAELNEATGIADSIFCHSSRHLAGARSFESIMILAKKALEY